MTALYEAVVLAAGRFSHHDADRTGVSIKALLRIDGLTMIERAATAVRNCGFVNRLIVVAPKELHELPQIADVWVEEQPTGADNLLAGLAAVASPQALVCSSDMPFITDAHVRDFLERVPPATDLAYPIFTRDEFLDTYPNGRSRFAKVGATSYTGGSLCLMNVAMAHQHANLIRRGFESRKSLWSLAALLGPRGLMRYLTGSLQISDVERCVSELAGGRAVAIRGTHPALAMDCDRAEDVAYVCRLAATMQHA